MELFVLVQFWLTVFAIFVNCIVAAGSKTVEQLSVKVVTVIIEMGWAIWAGLLLWGAK